MKKLLLMTTMLMFSVAAFGAGEVICEDRTSVDSVQEFVEKVDGACPEGSTENSEGKCVSTPASVIENN